MRPSPVPVEALPRSLLVFVRRRNATTWEQIGKACLTLEDAKATAEGATDPDIQQRIVVEVVADGQTTVTCVWH